MPATPEARPGSTQHLLAAAAVLYMIGATAWAMPGDSTVQRFIRANFADLFTTLGLWQNWNMFAPIPRHVDTWVAASVEFDDGVVVEWSLTRLPHLGLWERYSRDRWRKYFGDEFPKSKQEPAWDPACKWLATAVAREQARDTDEVVRVELVSYSRPCLMPPSGWDGWSAELESREYHRKVFHTWRPAAP